MARKSGRPTIIDIAEKAGVSFKTVSRVLNDNPRVAQELRERVLKAAAELDYRPNLAARSLAGPRSYTIAMLVAVQMLDLSREEDWYLPPFISDLQMNALLACQRMGYRFSVETIDSEIFAAPDKVRRQLARDGIDGVILVPPLCDDMVLLDALEAHEVPYVRLAPGIDPGRGASIATDEYGGAAAMTRRLLELGHRRIGFVAGSIAHRAAAVRQQAYGDMLAQVPDAAPPMIEQGDFTFNSGLEAAGALLDRPDRPTAIFCANDDSAAGALAAAAQRGIRVPEQLSVAGFDDSATARLTWPRLTTIRQPLAAMTLGAVRYLAAVTSGAKSDEERLVLPFLLVERDSTGPAPA